MLRHALVLAAAVLPAWPGLASADAQPDSPFRAGGNEPGWHIEIADGRIALVTGYGAQRAEAPLPEPETEDGATVYRVPELEATVRIEDALCRDDATGMPHPNTVTVQTDDATLSGCGGQPADLLTGPDWVVEDIGGRGIVDRSRVTIAFLPDGRAAGTAGCNRYFTSYTLTGEGIGFDPAGSSMMMCADALMTQERRFLEALEAAAAFDIDATGALLLKGPDGTVLVRARRG
jgi:heat shock protein HslJ